MKRRKECEVKGSRLLGDVKVVKIRLRVFGKDIGRDRSWRSRDQGALELANQPTNHPSHKHRLSKCGRRS